MVDFKYYTPTEVVFGKDSEAQLPGLVRKWGGTKVLIHYGGGSVVRSGLLAQVKKQLDEAGIAWVELGGVVPNPACPSCTKASGCAAARAWTSCSPWAAAA